MFLAGDVHPGNAADDPLYLPLYRRCRGLLNRTGLLYVGDCKMAAIETRAEMAADGDFYLTRLPSTGEVAAQFAAWVEAALTGDAVAKVVEIPGEEEPIARGYEFERGQTASVGETAPTWTERVQIIRSETAAEGQAKALERRLEQAEAAVRGLTPPPGPGRRRFTTHWELERAVAACAGGARCRGAVGGELGAARDQPDQVQGPGPRRPESPQDDRMGGPLSDHDGAASSRGRSGTGWSGWAGRYWRVNSPAERLSLAEALLDLPRGPVCGAAVPRVQGRAVGDPAVLRAAG